MPVILGEISVLTTPLAMVRILEMLFGCTTFSLVSLASNNETIIKSNTYTFCMFTWCFFFILTALIFLVEFVQFQSLVPISWKNLPITMALLGALMTLMASIGFPYCAIMHEISIDPSLVAASIFSCLTFLAYAAEVCITKVRNVEQRGYMATTPGFLKVFEVFGACVVFVTVDGDIVQMCKAGPLFWWCVVVYCSCFLMSLCTIGVMLGECTGRCPVPFDRILAGFGSLCVLMYITAVGYWVWALVHPDGCDQHTWKVITATVMTCLNLLAYTVDLAFSIKLLYYRT
ncbi:hypothetical protein AOXY_G18750 [Acipenser oxyrinchus oxyrinchus]|uniref:MARVEL domain-containing protein n=1 Tax=Acipenser oxyrinchus oxyrinchus TaxID=40147 RepID=A0AAD8D2F5_ACIOX|nr:hypothetical protein AOXY_G18750 [Acipenser oxyrinchus oxyrinchus]